MDARNNSKVPTWVLRVAGKNGALVVWHLMDKQIYPSDACNQQNRFLITKRVIAERLLPAMSEAEKQAASFLNHLEDGRRRRRRGRALCGERRRRLLGRNHGGLEVTVYDQTGWGSPLLLARWDGSGAAVLKGPNYRTFRHHCFMEAGDDVEIWAFRDKNGNLCFAVGNMTVSSLFSL